MKKFLMTVLLILVLGGIVFAIVKVNEKSSELANKNAENSKAEISTKAESTLEITDNYFIEKTNDVYMNLKDYVGRKVKFEGLIYSYESADGKKLYAVVRNTPGCCGNDGLAGLDIRYDKDYPEENTWVEIIGTIESETINGEEIPAVKVSSLAQKETGTTFVTN